MKGQLHEARVLLIAARQHPRASLHLVSLDIPAAFEMPKEVTVHATWNRLLHGDANA